MVLSQPSDWDGIAKELLSQISFVTDQQGLMLIQNLDEMVTELSKMRVNCRREGKYKRYNEKLRASRDGGTNTFDGSYDKELNYGYVLGLG